MKLPDHNVSHFLGSRIVNIAGTGTRKSPSTIIGTRHIPLIFQVFARKQQKF